MKNHNIKHIITILAYNHHQLTCQVIKNLREKGNMDRIVLLDNGSNPPYGDFLNGENVTYHRKEDSLYVNAGWNIIFDMCECNYLTLLNNDCFIISKNYFSEVIIDMWRNDIAITSCNTIDLTRYNGRIINDPLLERGKKRLKLSVNSKRQGWLMTIDMNKYK